MDYNYDIVNIHSKKEMKRIHNDNEKWKNYAQRMQKNPFVKNYLMNKYNGICQYCGLPIKNNLQLQHKTYDKECVTEETIRVHHSTVKYPNGTRKVPDCENCENFNTCIDDSLYPVYAYCNNLINKETYKIKRKSK